jgi:hypothetical protein
MRPILQHRRRASNRVCTGLTQWERRTQHFRKRAVISNWSCKRS